MIGNNFGIFRPTNAVNSTTSTTPSTGNATPNATLINPSININLNNATSNPTTTTQYATASTINVGLTNANITASGATSAAAAATATNNSNAATSDERNQTQVLSDFMMQLEDYNPSVPDAVISYYMNTHGLETNDVRIVRLIGIAAQKFISDVANDALQHCKTRTHNQQQQQQQTVGGAIAAATPKTAGTKIGSKDRRYTLTFEDLAPALQDYGITARKPTYFT